VGEPPRPFQPRCATLLLAPSPRRCSSLRSLTHQAVALPGEHGNFSDFLREIAYRMVRRALLWPSARAFSARVRRQPLPRAR
jgi:hypothetical protein